MEENKPVKAGAGEALSQDQATSISGGDGSTTAAVNTGAINVSTTTTGDPGAALTAIYEGFVDVTSHIIERVVTGVKS